MNITVVAGARPNFMKIAPILRAIANHNAGGGRPIHFRLVHTGQHYDDRLSEVFFRELELPHPDVNLGVGSGLQAEQTARIMIEFEKDLMQNPSDLVMVVGDVNSTMACTIVAKKMNVRVAHVEGGIRSFDMSMPEEVNRIVTDSLADYFFTTSEVAGQNLKKTGIAGDRIYFVGNTMIDSLTFSLPKLRKPSVWDTLELRDKSYLVLTLHRPSNVDDVSTLDRLLTEIELASSGLPVIFPVHPRTKRNFDILSRKFQTVKGIDPQSYFEFVYLVRSARGVITDSGGVQEETTVLGVPCVTLRTTTERPETIIEGTNELIGNDTLKLRQSLDDMLSGRWKTGRIPALWDGKAANRIVQTLASLDTRLR